MIEKYNFPYFFIDIYTLVLQSYLIQKMMCLHERANVPRDVTRISIYE